MRWDDSAWLVAGTVGISLADSIPIQIQAPTTAPVVKLTGRFIRREVKLGERQMGRSKKYKRLQRRRYKQGVSIRHRVVGGRTGALRQKQRAGMLKEIKKRKVREQRLAASAATKAARLGDQSGMLNRGNLVSTPSSTGSAASVTPKKKREHRAPKPPSVPVNNLGAALSRSGVAEAALTQRVSELEDKLLFADARADHYSRMWQNTVIDLAHLRSFRLVRAIEWLYGKSDDE